MVEPSAPTGEDLPSGTGYINLTLSPVVKRLGNFTMNRPQRSNDRGDGLRHKQPVPHEKGVCLRLVVYDTVPGSGPMRRGAFKRNVLLGSWIRIGKSGSGQQLSADAR